MIAYLTALTVVWAVGLVIYALLLRPIASHAYNRAYLLLVVLAGLVAPLAPGWSAGDIGVGALTEGTTVWLSTLTVYANGGGATAADAEFAWGTPGRWLWYGYLLGLGVSALVIGRLLSRLAACFGESRPYGRVGAMLVRELPMAEGPFSVGRHLFVKDWEAYAEVDARALLSHEAAHHRHRHIYDRALVMLLRTVFWFHPLAYVVDRELRLVHEYQADAVALASTELESYRRLLLAHQFHTRRQVLAAAFAQSPLQNRFAMMTKTFDSKQGWRVAVATFALLITAVACSKEEPQVIIDQEVYASRDEFTEFCKNHKNLQLSGRELSERKEDGADPDIVLIATTADGKDSMKTIFHRGDHLRGSSFRDEVDAREGTKGTIQMTAASNNLETVHKIVEQMPAFAGAVCAPDDRACAEKAMLEYMYSHIQYPSDDRASGTEGKVIASFTVERDGSLTDIKAIRYPSVAMAEEVGRMLRGMPRWRSGTHEGRPARVSFVLPVQFALD